MGGEVVEQFFFATVDAFLSSKPLQVGKANVGDVAVGGFCNVGQQGDFFLVIGAHFHHHKPWSLRSVQQRQRHAYVVVEVARRGVNIPLGGKDIPKSTPWWWFCRCFP